MYRDIDFEDRKLIDAAIDVIKRNFRDPMHTVGVALLCGSEKIYTGVNVESCGYGPCAEPIAIGAAVTNGERSFEKIVAVSGRNSAVIPPCGNCRQLLFDYAPDIEVILPHAGKTAKTTIKELFPDPYSNFD